VTETMRVIIADDERPARRFLAALLQSCAGVELAGEAGTGTEALTLIESMSPTSPFSTSRCPNSGASTSPGACRLRACRWLHSSRPSMTLPSKPLNWMRSTTC